MNEVKITYETLFDLLRREKDREELQELDETFYNDVLDYLEQKQSFMKESSTQGDMFGASETEKTRMQIQNIKKIIKDLYEKRQQKILRLAVNNSKVNSSLINTVAMLPEEKVFFEQSLAVLSRNRADVLNKILFFGNGNGHTSPAPQAQKPADSEPVKEEPIPEPKTSEIEPEIEGEIAEPTEEPETEVPQIETEEERESTSVLRDPEEVVEPVQEASEEVTVDEQPSDDTYETKIKVRFKGTVPKFVGKKMELYGPYNEGDEDELPKIIANILLNKDKAEEI